MTAQGLERRALSALDAITVVPGAVGAWRRAALDAVGTMFDGRREFARRRHVVISASPELQERELIKLAALARALGDALAARGVPGPTAELTALVAVAVFHVSFAGWVGERGGPSLSERMSGALDDLADVASGG